MAEQEIKTQKRKTKNPGLPKILFVHHPRLVKKKIDFRLRVQGYDVEISQYGFQSLSMLEKASFDMVLIDDELLDMSGYELLLIIRGKWDSNELPVAIFTADIDQEEMARVMDAGATHMILKSQNINTLFNILKKEFDVK